MNKEIQDILNEVTDEVIEEYFKNHMVIFKNENEKKKELFKSISFKQKRWNKRQECIFNGCKNRSIKRSHTIQKSGPIKSVSKNSIVMTPEFDYKNRVLVVRCKGINDASVFPGFCEDHENLFRIFEEEKKIDTEKAITLQLYRTISREIFRLQVEIEAFEKQKSDYISFRNSKFIQMVEKKLTPKWLKDNDISIQDFNITEDSCLTAIENNISELNETYREVKDNHLCEIERALEVGIDISAHVFNIDTFIPVALSGMGSFYVSPERRVLVFAGIYPSNANNTTCITFFTKKNDFDCLEALLSQCKNNLDFICLLEQFMVRGTDHWFINPDIWHRKSEKTKNKIITDLQDTKKGINYSLDYSIFDELREEIIKSATEIELPQNVKIKIEAELKKLQET